MEYKIKNYMELVVDEIIEVNIQNIKGCKCHRCVSDIKSLILNNMPPDYAVIKVGESYDLERISDLRGEYESKILYHFLKAAEIVGKNARH